MAKQEIKTEIIEIADEKKINAAINRVNKKIESIQRGYISIVGDIAFLKESKAHELNGYNSFYTFCEDKFGISRGMVHNLLSIYERYGEHYDLTDEAKELSCRQMLAQIKEEKQSQQVKPKQEKKKDKKKHETILDFNFTNVGEWLACDLINYLQDEIGDTLSIPDGSTIHLEITT